MQYSILGNVIVMVGAHVIVQSEALHEEQGCQDNRNEVEDNKVQKDKYPVPKREFYLKTQLCNSPNLVNFSPRTSWLPS
jgi:hypothetical protein